MLSLNYYMSPHQERILLQPTEGNEETKTKLLEIMFAE